MFKKSQVGETVSWAVGTIIIVVVLLIGIYLAGAGNLGKNILGEKNVAYNRISDSYARNSFYSYLKTEFGGETPYDYIKNTESFDDVEKGEFAKKVFEGIYEDEDYRGVWLGITQLDNWRVGTGVTFNGEENDFFGGRPKTDAASNTGDVITLDYVQSYLFINQNKSVEFLLVTYLK